VHPWRHAVTLLPSARCTHPYRTDILADQENSERTAGGLVGAIAGKAKEAAGSLVGLEQAARKRQEKKRDAAEIERKRLAASRQAASRSAKAEEQRAAKERLKSLDVKADALGEREQVLTATDEAKRLGDAASRVKAERKTGPNGNRS